MKMKYGVYVALSLLCAPALQAATVFLFNGTEKPISAVVMCNLIHDTKNNPYTIYPQFRLSIPFIQKGAFCDASGFKWKETLADGTEQYFYADEPSTRFWVPGNDLNIILGNGSYIRVIVPTGIVIVDIARFLGEKLRDIQDAVKSGLPFDAIFKTIGLPYGSFSLRTATSIPASDF